MAADWIIDRFASLDWGAISKLPASATCEESAKIAQSWLDEELNPDKKEALAVLRDVLSMGLLWEPKGNEPFFDAHLLDRIPREAMVALSGSLAKIEHPETRARIADAAWQKGRACSPQAAGQAAKDYLTTAVALYNPTEWSDSFTRLQRGVRLAASLGTNQNLFAEVSVAALEMLRKESGIEPLYFSARTIELLLDQRIGDATELAGLAAGIAARAEAEGQHDRSRQYLDITAACWHRAGKPEQAASARRQIALSLETEAATLSATAEGAGRAAFLLEQAIELHRSIAGSSAEVERLKPLLQHARTAMIPSFRRVDLGTVDLSACVEMARVSVRGKPRLDAMVNFVMLFHPVPLVALRQGVMKDIGKSPLFALPRRVAVSPTGQVLHRDAGFAGGGTETTIETRMHQELCLQRKLVVAGAILPALQILQAEHGLRKEDMFYLASRSPFVPTGREEAFALGLDAGLSGDFFTAAHILIPQYEHALRWHLGQRGVVTVTFPQSGIQNAFDLNTLLNLPAITCFLDEATLFDLKNLLTEKAGANMRNLLAHGLIEPGTQTHNFVYLWWVVLRFVLLPLIQEVNAS